MEDIDLFRDRERGLAPDVRPLRIALEELDLRALDRLAQGDVLRILAGALQSAAGAPTLGWTATDERPCPMLLAGKPCLGSNCICTCGPLDVQQFGRVWATPEGPTLVIEMYAAPGLAISAFLQVCQAIGLDTIVSGAYPGTARIEARQQPFKESQEGRDG